MRNPEGIIDYGSLIYITLQRASSAREAIRIFSELVDNYGYYSSGEIFLLRVSSESPIHRRYGSLSCSGKAPVKKGAMGSCKEDTRWLHIRTCQPG
ncbi:MAG: C69 family dipeptidase [Bacteroidales bacterium]